MQLRPPFLSRCLDEDAVPARQCLAGCHGPTGQDGMLRVQQQRRSHASLPGVLHSVSSAHRRASPGCPLPRKEQQMHPDLEQLIPLQEMDVAAQRLREAIAAAPKRVLEAAATVSAASGRLAALQDQIGKEEALRRRLESDIGDQRQKLERGRKRWIARPRPRR